MSYNARIILNEILTNSTFTITRANCGLFRTSDEWSKLKEKIKSIPTDCQLIYLEGWIKRRIEEDTAKECDEKERKERKEKDRKEREEKERKEREEKERKEREEKERKEREERESSVARHTLFAHYGPGLAFAVPTPGYPGKHLVHLGGGAFIPGPPPIGFISPGFIPGPCFIRAHRF
jgi:hypothetical protein